MVAVTASAAAAVVARTSHPDGRSELLLRAVSLSPEATTRGGVLAWQVRLEVDCRTGEVRAGPTTGYASRTAEGDGVQLAPGETAWRRPHPATALESAWRAACDPAFRSPLGGGPARLASLPAAPAPTAAPAPPVAAQPAAAYAREATANAGATGRPGGWVVQVVSSSDAADTRQTLARVRSRYAADLQGLETRVDPAQVRGRKVYRGVVAGFASSGAASEFCTTLKRDGRDCLAR